MPYYCGCPQCKKTIKSGGICPDHGTVPPNQISGAAAVIQDSCTTLEATLWKESLEALRSEFGVGPEVADTEVMPLLAHKTYACQLVARMGVGNNKN